MKSYTKYKKIPIQIILISLFALLAQHKIQANSYAGYLFIWMTMAIFVVIFNYSTYKIDISDKKIIIKKLFRRNREYSFDSITEIRFEGYSIRGHWILMSLCDQDNVIGSAEISSLCSKKFVRDIVNRAAMNGIILNIDNDSKKIFAENFND